MKQLIIISFIVLMIVFIIMYVSQRHLIYHPSPQVPHLPEYHANDMTVITLHTQDNLELMSWYKPAINNQPTVLYLHGNAGHIGYRMHLARQFINAGLGVLLLEYRGYGGNKGRPSEQGLYKDGQAALTFLNQQGIKPEKLILYGESLGTGVATELASKHAVCAVILQAPYTSLIALAHFHYPLIFLKPWDKFDSLARIQAINAPLLVLHGEQDNVVPYKEGLTLFNAANEPKKMITFRNLDHHNLWDTPDFSREVLQFINSHCN